MKGDFDNSDEFADIYVNNVLVDTCDVGTYCGGYVDCGTFHGDVGSLSVRVQSSATVHPLCDDGLSMQVQFLLHASHGSNQPKIFVRKQIHDKPFCIVILLEAKLYQILL